MWREELLPFDIVLLALTDRDDDTHALRLVVLLHPVCPLGYLFHGGESPTVVSPLLHLGYVIWLLKMCHQYKWLFFWIYQWHSYSVVLFWFTWPLTSMKSLSHHVFLIFGPCLRWVCFWIGQSSSNMFKLTMCIEDRRSTGCSLGHFSAPNYLKPLVHTLLEKTGVNPLHSLVI